MELKMAEAVISKTCMFSSSCSSIQHQNNGVSSFPVKSTMVSSGMGFPSLKIATFSKKGNTRLSSPSPLMHRCPQVLLGKLKKWWVEVLQSNMKEINDAGDLVESLLNARGKLVVVEFFSPGCSG
ncbi:hypothetical protein RHSIM_Rhsim10G0035400 [Rhododendron simsii]|uniref:Thioredoxin domain-containing protein n=1 Tax=Rhododendron simsii TaxID=118357 RepID=A0A834GFD6_RHOSS|nr:hypothetical protein RHSIM_Rhsim10G0035400 [Rhododendron simsii]